MKIQLKSFIFFLILLRCARQLFLGIPPFISDPVFLILIFCESLVLYDRSRGLCITDCTYFKEDILYHLRMLCTLLQTGVSRSAKECN